MPTNLPPEYYHVEKRYKEAETPEEKLTLLEELISTIPKHKGTDHLRSDLRRKISKMKDSAQNQKKAGGQASVFQIDKEGAGQCVVIGCGNTGKSSLVAKYTNADPDVAEFPFSTWQPTPGMMMYENVQIQIIDSPALDMDYVEPEFIQMIRRAELIILMVDLQADPLGQLEFSENFLVNNRIIPMHLQEKYPERGNKYSQVLVLVNKVDTEEQMEDFQVYCDLLDANWECVPLSVKTEFNVDVMMKEIYDRLGVIRIYSKPLRKEPDFTSPFVIKEGSTVEDFAMKVHKDFYDQLKTARLWGGVDYDGMMVSRSHVLKEGDIVELKK